MKNYSSEENKYKNIIKLRFLLLFNDNKIRMARKPGKKQKENPVGCTGESKRWKGNMREGKTETVLELSLKVRWPLWGWLSQGQPVWHIKEQQPRIKIQFLFDISNLIKWYLVLHRKEKQKNTSQHWYDILGFRIFRLRPVSVRKKNLT